MPTQSKSETARRNGAKSRCPKTAEGREKSSRNALKHGFTSHNSIVLAVENPAQFQQLLDEHIAIYQPANPAELDLVEEMVTARWRIRRMWAVETSLIDNEMKRRKHVDEDNLERLAEAFRTLADDSRALALASRYESRLHRTHERAYETLRELQRERKSGETNPSQPQPHDLQATTGKPNVAPEPPRHAAGRENGHVPDPPPVNRTTQPTSVGEGVERDAEIRSVSAEVRFDNSPAAP